MCKKIRPYLWQFPVVPIICIDIFSAPPIQFTLYSKNTISIKTRFLVSVINKWSSFDQTEFVVHFRNFDLSVCKNKSTTLYLISRYIKTRLLKCLLSMYCHLSYISTHFILTHNVSLHVSYKYEQITSKVGLINDIII